MDPLYWLKKPSEPASAPRRWSYSALAIWRTCPRRWWLLNSRYENVRGTSYPMVFGAAAIQGRLVHAALEAERKSGSSATADIPFQPRRFLKQALRDFLSDEVTLNPRLDRGRLEAAISLDDCLAKFFALSEGPGPRTGSRPSVVSQFTGPPRDAQEFWLEVEDPPLAGRIDQIRSHVLVDLKTGEEDLEAHGEQLRLYAALWWLRFGRPPAGLEVRYPNRTHVFSTPGEADLHHTAQSFKAELKAISLALAEPPPPARPAVETCTFCPVRQLCPEYWQASATRPLRTAPGLNQSPALGPPMRDVELTHLPDHWKPGDSLNGIAEAAEIGPTRVNLPRTLCPEEGAQAVSGVRLLQVLLLSHEDGTEVRRTSATEAFWISENETGNF